MNIDISTGGTPYTVGGPFAVRKSRNFTTMASLKGAILNDFSPGAGAPGATGATGDPGGATGATGVPGTGCISCDSTNNTLWTNGLKCCRRRSWQYKYGFRCWKCSGWGRFNSNWK